MISITYITVTYNAASVLQRTLDSVLAQDYPDIVHLIIDGQSTDATLTMAQAYADNNKVAANGHQVLIFSGPDEGIYDAMNKALRQPIKTDYVCFLNAGDFLPSNDTASRIAAQVEALDHDTDFEYPAVLYGNTDIVDDEGRYLHPRRLSPPEHLTWKSFHQGMLVCHQAFYARTDIAKQTPYNLCYHYSADVDWCIRIMKRAMWNHDTLHNLHMVVACYNEEGTTTRNHHASLMERFHVMSRHYGLTSTILMHGWFVLRSLFKP